MIILYSEALIIFAGKENENFYGITGWKVEYSNKKAEPGRQVEGKITSTSKPNCGFKS